MCARWANVLTHRHLSTLLIPARTHRYVSLVSLPSALTLPVNWLLLILLSAVCAQDGRMRPQSDNRSPTCSNVRIYVQNAHNPATTHRSLSLVSLPRASTLPVNRFMFKFLSTVCTQMGGRARKATIGGRRVQTFEFLKRNT